MTGGGSERLGRWTRVEEVECCGGVGVWWGDDEKGVLRSDVICWIFVEEDEVGAFTIDDRGGGGGGGGVRAPPTPDNEP